MIFRAWSGGRSPFPLRSSTPSSLSLTRRPTTCPSYTSIKRKNPRNSRHLPPPSTFHSLLSLFRRIFEVARPSPRKSDERNYEVSEMNLSNIVRIFVVAEENSDRSGEYSGAGCTVRGRRCFSLLDFARWRSWSSAARAAQLETTRRRLRRVAEIEKRRERGGEAADQPGNWVSGIRWIVITGVLLLAT